MKRLLPFILLLVPSLASAWDMGLNFRATQGFIQDQAYAVAITTNDTGSHTLTNANGDSVTIQSNPAWSNSRDRNNTVDARLAGINFVTGTTGSSTTITLPSTGGYNIGFALGDVGSAQSQAGVSMICNVTDNGSALFTVSWTNTLSANTFIDANNASWGSAGVWVTGNTMQSVTMTSTVLKVWCGSTNAAVNLPIAHIRITSTGGVSPTPTFNKKKKLTLLGEL